MFSRAGFVTGRLLPISTVRSRQPGSEDLTFFSRAAIFLQPLRWNKTGTKDCVFRNLLVSRDEAARPESLRSASGYSHMDQLFLVSAISSAATALLAGLGWLVYRACLGIALVIEAKGRREARRSAVRLATRRRRVKRELPKPSTDLQG